MPKKYNDDHLVDEFGRVIPYDNLNGSFPPGVSNEVKRATKKNRALSVPVSTRNSTMNI